MGPQRMFGMTPWVRRLFVANLVVFLFQMTIFVDPRFLTTFGFVPLRALAQPWTFLTYMFLHGGPLHLAFNLLASYVFGPEVEERMGGGPSLGYCLLCRPGGGVVPSVRTPFRPLRRVTRAGSPGPETPASSHVAHRAMRHRRRSTACSTRSRRVVSKASPPPNGNSSPT